MAVSRTCTQSIRSGRLKKAEQFAQAAETIREFADGGDDIGDAYVTLCVHAGIAAADVICCRRLGEHSYGDNHESAVRLLEKADKGMGRHLTTLLTLKTGAGYSHIPASGSSQKRAGRAAAVLVERARFVHSE